MHIAIAGNIGSGKTTLANLLAKHLGFEAQYEDPTSNPYIYDFYSDMNRWSFNLQVYFLNSRLKQTTQIQRGGLNIIQDRTLYEDAEIFTPNLLSMGLLSQRDYETYRNLYDTVIRLVKPPDLVIFLHGSTATLVDQITSRNREYEENLRLGYLERLNERYLKWYEGYRLGHKLDFDIDKVRFRDNPEDLGIILDAVRSELFGLFPNP
jgi:deoxyadenosine/deoxycytidine kinase